MHGCEKLCKRIQFNFLHDFVTFSLYMVLFTTFATFFNFYVVLFPSPVGKVLKQQD